MKIENTHKNHIQISTFYSSNANFTENANIEEYNNNSNLYLDNDKLYKAKTQKNKRKILNKDLKLKYSNSSINSHNSNNISNSSIQSIINIIGGKDKIKDIKITKYNLESNNNTNINNSKYGIKNYSHVSNNQKKDKY